MSEVILFSCDAYQGIPASRYVLLFTNARIVVAFVAGGATRVLTAGLLRDLYKGGKVSKMTGESIDKLLRSSDKNYAIPYEYITRLDVEKGGVLKGGSIKIYTTTGRVEKFRANLRKKVESMEFSLRPYLGEKLNISPPVKSAVPQAPVAPRVPLCRTCG